MNGFGEKLEPGEYNNSSKLSGLLIFILLFFILPIILVKLFPNLGNNNETDYRKYNYEEYERDYNNIDYDPYEDARNW